MKQIFSLLTGAFVLFAFGSTTLGSPKGAIPIYQATTISQPGHYLVTRDFSASATAILIQSSNVHLDLGGHTISPGTYGISVSSGDYHDISISNGTLEGGTYGLYFYNTLVEGHIKLHKVRFYGQSIMGIRIHYVKSLDVSNCVVMGTGGTFPQYGIYSVGLPSNPTMCSITNSQFENFLYYGLFLSEITGSRIERNSVKSYNTASPSTDYAGISIYTSSSGKGTGNSIEYNLIQGGGNAGFGLQLSPYSSGNIIANNTSSNSNFGLLIQGPSNLVERNVANNNVAVGFSISGTGCIVRYNLAGNNGTNGITMASNSLAEFNTTTNNVGTGLFLTSSTSTYRNNFSLGNAVAYGGSGTDGGGNI